MSDIFERMPEIPEEVYQRIRGQFENYLFFETVKRGQRKWTCTSCGAHFESKQGELKRTMKQEDYSFPYSQHNSFAACPKCGARNKVINVKLRSPEKLNESKCYAVFLPASPELVFCRCIMEHRFFEGAGVAKDRFWSRECMRYVFSPGSGEMYEPYYGGSRWDKNKIAREAFLWNHGLYCEKYSYQGIWVDLRGQIVETGGRDQQRAFDGTFLKYNSFFSYEGVYGFNFPYVKYLCWYARHPQIEMLAKTGHDDIINLMILENSDRKKVFDWSANTPWGVHRLSKPLYKVFMKERYDMVTLEAFQRLKGKSEKDLDTAYRMVCMVGDRRWGCYGKQNGSPKNLRAFFALCRKVKAEPREVLKYIEKVHRDSAGGCHHCPGITVNEAYELWQDYLSMAILKDEAAGLKPSKYTFNPLPKDLKAAHDGLLRFKQYQDGMKQIKDVGERIKEMVKRAEREEGWIRERTAAVEKKFPRIGKVYEKIGALYAFGDEDYTVAVPTSAYDIVKEGFILDHCVDRAERYYDRIERRESYTLFLRRTKEPDLPWYTLEVEPDGTIRQKRTLGDKQLPDIEKALAFLTKWQKEVAGRLSKNERSLGQRSKKKRDENFAQLRKEKTTIHYGDLRGRLLVEVLEEDLMINKFAEVS